jgi:transcriptional regulator with XRE-family HTH domain
MNGDRMSGPAATGRITGFKPLTLQNLRHTKDWSQSRLAAEIGVTHATITSWESGWRTPEPDNLVRLAAALDVGLEALIGPRNTWTLTDLRNAKGLQQGEAADLARIAPRRFRHIEIVANNLTDEVAGILASIYDTPVEEIRECWARARQELTNPPTTKQGAP